MLSTKKKNACGKQIDHRVLGGTLKSMNIENRHTHTKDTYMYSNDDCCKFHHQLREIFKHACKHVPCVTSTHRAIYDPYMVIKNKNAHFESDGFKGCPPDLFLPPMYMYIYIYIPGIQISYIKNMSHVNWAEL